MFIGYIADVLSQWKSKYAASVGQPGAQTFGRQYDIKKKPRDLSTIYTLGDASPDDVRRRCRGLSMLIALPRQSEHGGL